MILLKGRLRLTVMLLGMIAAPAAAPANDLWIELIHGDLSDDRLAPTPLVLSLGDNFLYGIMSGAKVEGGYDLDYFSVTVPAGFQLAALTLDHYDSPDFAAFLGIQPGPIFPNDPGDVAPGDLMGFVHMGPQHIGQDLLPIMASMGYGFTPPLQAGVYSFWAQQIDDYTDWTGNFVVTAVPEPTSLAMLVLAGATCIVRRRRRSSHS